jgi:hypothetical protein
MSAVISILTLSCDTDQAPECFKTSGEPSAIEFELNPFHSIVVMDEADVYLENGRDQRVEVKAGKNLISDIHFDVRDSVLTIRNGNKCNWRRMPGNPGIYIQNDRLRRIEIYDYTNFFTPDTLALDELTLYSDGTGNFELAVNINTLRVESIYVSNFHLSGKVMFLEISFGDDSKFHGKNLISDFNNIQHFGSNLIEIFPVKEMTGELGSTGSLCYFHEPEYMDVKISHTGQLKNCYQ